MYLSSSVRVAVCCCRFVWCSAHYCGRNR